MRKFLVLTILLSLSTIACDAFKDSYDGARAVENKAPLPPPDGDKKPGNDDVVIEISKCEAIKEVVVKKSEESAKETSLTGAGEVLELSTKAEKVTDDTTKISILSGKDAVLSFTLKKSGEEFSACEVTYKDLKVTKGEITVDSFGDVNSGTFSFEFTAPDATVGKAAIDAIADLVKAVANTVLEGTYYTETLAVE